ncbi:MAG: flagellar basal body L-ring protein FlgH [Desulfovibrionales bacterium]|nr:flagellar basal body L-ring protein FlgH [Desulfovibrionales bacterium]
MKTRAIYTLILALGLAGCTASSRPPMPPAIVMPPPQEKIDAVHNPGSLYDPDGANLLFADARARRVGDVLLVKVVETTLAKNKASTTADKDNSFELGAESFLGKDHLPLISGAKVGPNAMVSAGSKSKFSGDGETKRESSLMTTVAARVTKVLGGGLLEIVGARETRVNGETQIVLVQGVARDRDIDADNTIQSTSLAEARIELYGEGVLADKQKPGWLGRLLDNVWPF